jgi:hypothetical protein
MRFSILGSMLALALGSGIGAAWAEAEPQSALTLRAFGSVYGTKFTRDDASATFDNDANHFSMRRDTRLGLGVSYKYSDRLDAFAQEIFYRSRVGRESDLDLLVLNYHPSEFLTLRFGRESIPIFLYSEQSQIGVTYPWIEPPLDSTPINPLRSIDGVRATYRSTVGKFQIQGDAYAGTGDATIHDGAGATTTDFTATIRDGYGFNAEIESARAANAGFRLRAGYFSGLVSIETQTKGAPTVVPGAGTTTTSFYNSYDLGRTSFYSFGASFHLGETELISEYALRLAHTEITPRTAAFYVTILHHFGAWTPYFTVYRMIDNEGMLRPHPLAATGVAPYTTAKFERLEQQAVGLSFEADPAVIFKGEIHRFYDKYDNSAVDLKSYFFLVGADFVLF